MNIHISQNLISVEGLIPNSQDLEELILNKVRSIDVVHIEANLILTKCKKKINRILVNLTF